MQKYLWKVDSRAPGFNSKTVEYGVFTASQSEISQICRLLGEDGERTYDYHLTIPQDGAEYLKLLIDSRKPIES